MKRITSLLLLALIVGLGYHYRDYGDDIVRTLLHRYAPCRTAIGYEAGELDPRFGLSKEAFESAVGAGEKIWEDAAGMELFDRRESGELAVSLVYDERQEVTERLSRLGVAIRTTREAYNEVKAKYEEIYAAYRKEKAAFEGRLTAYEERRGGYQKK